MNFAFQLLCRFGLLLPVIGCSGTGNSTVPIVVDHPSFIGDSVIGILNALGNETEKLNMPSTGGQDCTASAFSSCQLAVITARWNSCTFLLPSGSSKMSGEWKLTFDSEATCTASTVSPATSLPASGSLVKTSLKQGTFGSKIARPDGTSLLSYTNTHLTYRGTSIGGGITTTYGSPNESRTIQVTGIQRVFLDGSGSTVFNHSLFTTFPHLSMTGRRSFANRSVSGSLTVLNNASSIGATITLNSVTWGNSNCNFPTSGTGSITFSDGASGDALITFTGCATATYRAQNGDTTPFDLSFND